ncbi:MAG: PAS domain-containing protein [Oligoflexia bacterium]|nr:PAS domain-containing protein [Oligoflexia bacterium]
MTKKQVPNQKPEENQISNDEGDENYLKKLLFSSPDIILNIDRQYNIISINRQSLKTLDIHKDVLGKNIFSLLKPEVRATGMEIVNRCVESGEIQTWEHPLINDIWISSRIVPIKQSDGQISELMVVGTEITNQRAARIALLRQHKQFEELLNTVNVILWEADPQTLKFTFINHKVEEILGFPISLWLNEKNFFLNRIHPDDRNYVMDRFKKGIKENIGSDYNFRIIHKNGEALWFKISFSVVIDTWDQDEGNSIIRIRGIMLT